MERIKIGFIGLGQRGDNLLADIVLKIKPDKIVGICDLYDVRLKKSEKNVVNSGYSEPIMSEN